MLWKKFCRAASSILGKDHRVIGTLALEAPDVHIDAS